MSADYDAVWEGVYGDMQDVGPVHRHMRRLLRRMLAPLDYATAVEVGCGAGHNLDLIADGRALDDLVGTDVSAVALDRAARARPGLRTAQLDITAGALPERFDLVFCALVLEHVADDRAALAHMAAMAGRHVVLTTIAGDFARYRSFDEQLGHVRNYARGELEAKLADVGLEVREAVYWGFPLFTPLQRTLQNRSRAEPSYSPAARALARALYALYFANSSRRGDLLLVRAEATSRSDVSSAIAGA